MKDLNFVREFTEKKTGSDYILRLLSAKTAEIIKITKRKKHAGEIQQFIFL